MSWIQIQGLGNGVGLETYGFAYESSVSFTRPANSGIYSVNDVVADAGNALPLTGLGPSEGAVEINSVSLRIDSSIVPTGTSGFRIHLYSSGPSGIADNLPFDLPAADRAKYLGYIALPVVDNFKATFWSQANDLNFQASNAPTHAIVQTLAVYSPGVSDVYTLKLKSTQLS